MLAIAVVLTASACRIGDNVTDVGEPCDDSSECEGALGCVPTDDDNPAGPRVCMPPPKGWNEDRCQAFFIGDEEAICDCGCGAHDVDCADETAASCAGEDSNHCPEGEDPVADDNTRCE